MLFLGQPSYNLGYHDKAILCNICMMIIHCYFLLQPYRLGSTPPSLERQSTCSDSKHQIWMSQLQTSKLIHLQILPSMVALCREFAIFQALLSTRHATNGLMLKRLSNFHGSGTERQAPSVQILHKNSTIYMTNESIALCTLQLFFFSVCKLLKYYRTQK